MRLLTGFAIDDTQDTLSTRYEDGDAVSLFDTIKEAQGQIEYAKEHFPPDVTENLKVFAVKIIIEDVAQ